jgi:hypothetical protein
VRRVRGPHLLARTSLDRDEEKGQQDQPCAASRAAVVVFPRRLRNAVRPSVRLWT